MNFEWLLAPLSYYLALGLGLCGCLLLFFSAKFEVRRLTRTTSLSVAELSERVKCLAETIDQLKQDFNGPGPRPSGPDLTPSLNLTKRARALRMHMRGETAETIAATMRTPQNEVSLLLRVEEMLTCERVAGAEESSGFGARGK